jgi:seryl-tRNA synthetase
VASPRILIAILENYQQKDGSVKIPKVLQKYFPKKNKIIKINKNKNAC